MMMMFVTNRGTAKLVPLHGEVMNHNNDTTNRQGPQSKSILQHTSQAQNCAHGARAECNVEENVEGKRWASHGRRG